HMENPPGGEPGLGFERVDGVFTCSEAVALASKGDDYDLIVYDLSLPWEKGGRESRENGLRLVQEIGPRQPNACGILVSAHADIQGAFKLGLLGAVRRLIEKPVRPETIMVVAQEVLQEAAQKPQEAFERLRASYLVQSRVHDAMNSLNNILAAINEVEKICRPAGDFVPARSLPMILAETENIRRFQGDAGESLRAIHPAEAPGREPCDLRRIAEWCMKHLQRQDPRRKARIELATGPDGVPLTMGVREELEQMILLIATNARQAIGENGWVRISIDFDGGETREIILMIQDDGRGIPAADREHIFELGFKKRPDGLGQGLFLARAFARNHGGRIQIESEEGVGTTVTVRLPLREVHFD
ncbi:MAG: ATP-binding protein, partial [Thermoanaerobaculia bacterium]